MGHHASSLPFDFSAESLTGLSPSIWLSVGSGFSREDLKESILTQNRGGLVDTAISSLEGICLKITRIEKTQVLQTFARQEALRMLLAEPRIFSKMPELIQLKRQRQFFQRLDFALQSARMTFAHDEEEHVYEERLVQVLGVNTLRNDVRKLAQSYEAWMEASAYFDLPLLVRSAIRLLKQEGWPKHLKKPDEIWVFSADRSESLEQAFWDELGKSLKIIFQNSFQSQNNSQSNWNWMRWHTLDDAAEFLAQSLSLNTLEELDQHAVLIPDAPSIRRSLMRALHKYSIPLVDSRDPTRLRWEERVKWAFLPLQMVASQFEQQRVISWIKTWNQSTLEHTTLEHKGAWIREIYNRGVRRGLSGYAGGSLSELHVALKSCEQDFGGRKTIQDLSEHFLKYWSEQKNLESWVIPFFKTILNEIQTDLKRVGQETRLAPPLFWLEKLQGRLREMTPPVERQKLRTGLRLYRMQQEPLHFIKDLWVFGLPAQGLKAQGVGGYWFTDWEREILSSEFAIRSPCQLEVSRLRTLSTWILVSKKVIFLDSIYSEEGKERESIAPLLSVLPLEMAEKSFMPQDCGAHSRFLKSHGVVKRSQPQEVRLLPLINNEISATAMDRYSRCEFQALGLHHWKLADLKESDWDLWPEVRGQILHEAVRLLVQSRNPQGEYRLSIHAALAQVWKKPPGLIQGRRITETAQSKLIPILEAFLAKEKEYFVRSGAHPVSLDQTRLKLDYQTYSILGKPDRIDQHPDGLFIMDYKTSSGLPHGIDMIQQGYRLQLPFYAIAASRIFSAPILGVQFIELDRKGARKSGIFFKEWNGKQKGSLTHVRSNSKSLISEDPEQVWTLLEATLKTLSSRYMQGVFRAQPKLSPREKECTRCGLADLCGYRRISQEQKQELEQEMNSYSAIENVLGAENQVLTSPKHFL